jgi:hypothetical protein
MAGVPDISLSDVGANYTIDNFIEECNEALSDEDKKLMFYFFLKYDCLNLVELLQNPDAEISSYGNFNAEQYRDLITSATEMNFNVHRFPAFMSIFAREYSYNKGKVGYFPKDAIMLEYYKFAMECPNSMIASWYKMNFDISNILTAMIARQNGWNVGDYILGDNEICEMIRTNNTKDFNLSTEYDYISELMKIVDCDDPVEKERRIDAFRWVWLDDAIFFDVFCIDAVFAYMCKLEMLQRWDKLDVETGREKFRSIIENLRGEARVPDEFRR